LETAALPIELVPFGDAWVTTPAQGV